MKREDERKVNAFVDGELGAGEQAEVLALMQRDKALARQVCELNSLKQQVKLAYAEPPGNGRSEAGSRTYAWSSIAAALVMLAFGLVGGWLLHASVTESDRWVLLDADGKGGAPAIAGTAETRIVFHLTNPDQAVGGELLDEVEQMLIAYQEQGRPIRVEIVSHGEGLGLVRERLSGHKQRIEALAGSFGNLTFVACQNTIDRLKVERGVEVQLIPQAELTRSGVSHVVKRQKQGWSYIRV